MAAKLSFELTVNDKGSVVIKRFGKEVDKVAVTGGAFGAKMAEAAKGVGSLAVKMAAFGTVAAAGAAGFAAWKVKDFAMGVIGTASAFENLNVRLTTVQGSAEKAKESMAWIREFTAKTPFELEEVSAAFVKLEAYGLDATQWMEVLGDTASSMGKGLDQTVEMFADAMTGEFERLKEFGVKAKTEGDKVTFSWVQNNEQMQVTAQKTGIGISEALAGIFTRFQGGMVEASKTWTGMLSNLADKWTEFKGMVAESGFFQLVKEQVAGVLAEVERLADSGQLQAWAQDVSDLLSRVVEQLAGWIEYAYYELKALWEDRTLHAWADEAKEVLGGVWSVLKLVGETATAVSSAVAAVGGVRTGWGGEVSDQEWQSSRAYEAFQAANNPAGSVAAKGSGGGSASGGTAAAGGKTTNIYVQPGIMTGDAAGGRAAAREIGRALDEQTGRW